MLHSINKKLFYVEILMVTLVNSYTYNNITLKD